MKILIFSDLHGSIKNIFFFLEKNNNSFERILFAGDFFGYLIGSKEIIKFFQSHSIDFIIGNHDLYFLRKIFKNNFNFYYNKYKSFMMSLKNYQNKYGALFETCKQINVDELKPLLGQQFYKELIIDGLKFIICHGSIDDAFNEYIYPDSNKIDIFFQEYDFDVLILGHTHIPFIKEKKGKYIINPGSCTLPRGQNKSPTVIVCDTKDLNFKIIEIEQKIKYNRISQNKIILQSDN